MFRASFDLWKSLKWAPHNSPAVVHVTTPWLPKSDVVSEPTFTVVGTVVSAGNDGMLHFQRWDALTSASDRNSASANVREYRRWAAEMFTVGCRNVRAKWSWWGVRRRRTPLKTGCPQTSCASVPSLHLLSHRTIASPDWPWLPLSFSAVIFTGVYFHRVIQLNVANDVELTKQDDNRVDTNRTANAACRKMLMVAFEEVQLLLAAGYKPTDSVRCALLSEPNAVRMQMYEELW